MIIKLFVLCHNQLGWTSHRFVKAALCWKSNVYSNVCRREVGLSLRLLSPSLPIAVFLSLSTYAFLFLHLWLGASLSSSWGCAELITASLQARLWGKRARWCDIDREKLTERETHLDNIISPIINSCGCQKNLSLFVVMLLLLDYIFSCLFNCFFFFFF